MTTRRRPPSIPLDVEVRNGPIYERIHAERIRAHAKHGPNGMEAAYYDDPAWLAVLTEEVGEVARELCEHRHILDNAGDRPHFTLEHALSNHRRRLHDELVQVAAMAAAWAEAIEAGEAPARRRIKVS